MASRLLLSVRLHDGRFHGAEWPPSPLRLFQALVAGVGLGQGAGTDPGQHAALAALEGLSPPVILAPPARQAGRRVTLYVPNNQLDQLGGRLSELPRTRGAKRTIRPFLIEGDPVIHYLWEAGDHPEPAALRQIVERLHTLGWGIDAAAATLDQIESRLAGELVATHHGPVHRPGGSAGQGLAIPIPGTLDSLRRRHQARAGRLVESRRKGDVATYTRPPDVFAGTVAYNAVPDRAVYRLISADKSARRPLTSPATVTEQVRDAAIGRLTAALPDRAALINAVLKGRKDATEADKAARVRIIPLPSIGHAQTDPAIRRVLVEIPPNCPLPRADLEWTFAGLPLATDPETGEVLLELALEAESSMPRNYGIAPDGGDENAARLWRTVTPVALPDRQRRSRKAGEDRARDDAASATALAQALRHAGIVAKPLKITLQREPFGKKGARAEDFAPGTRFHPGQLTHAEILFDRAIAGPLVIGNGRYLGLGLMAPARGLVPDSDVFSFVLTGHRPPFPERAAVLRALRRALMARSADARGRVPPLFSGHPEKGNTPLRPGHHAHVFLAAEPDDKGRIESLIVAAPWACDHRCTASEGERRRFAAVIHGLTHLTCGKLGVLDLQPVPLARPRARRWRSVTAYSPTRHARKADAVEAAVGKDLAAECHRRGLPTPWVKKLAVERGPRGGLRAMATLVFSVALHGPLLLGRDSHAGGGLFVPEPEEDQADGAATG